VNKSYLPLASGEMSMKPGASIVAITSSLSIGMGDDGVPTIVRCRLFILFHWRCILR
ncbi:hypothetical protein IFM89_037520, partial [Coptis chinensis]